MKTMKKNKTVFKQPSFELSKNDVERKEKAYSNFFEGAKRQVKQDLGKFSSFNMIKNLILRKKEDPTNELILEIIKRMEKDKLQANISMHIAQKAQEQSQNIQKTSLIKMIPFLVSVLGIIICVSLGAGVKPLNLANPDLIPFAAPLLVLIPFYFWATKVRKDAKLDMLTINILMQASSAFASAKMQGKGAVAAMQNLSEMRVRSKKLEEKEKQKKAKK